MEPPLQSLTLFLVCFVFLVSASILVDSQSQDSPISPPPPPQSLTQPPPPPPVKVGSSKPIHEKHHQKRKWRQRRNRNHPQPWKLNTGKTVGLFFAGAAAALQVAVAAFLLIKRKQLLLKISNDNRH
ncbi:hypothetical protein DY000_02063750 [Brassica cretica]|uniref:Transmembrane protein n=1 Tax=Brassica cretica TaxID=69181 RepID=A0ABQ7B1Y1_BRACR|nr:hypothetical protein DY000_02063750 [Brassica cretica]